MAIPALVLLTAIVIVQVAVPPDPPSEDAPPTVTGAPGRPGASLTAAAPTAPMNGSEAAIAGHQRGNIAGGAPTSSRPAPASGTPLPVPPRSAAPGGQAYTYTIEVEDGLQSADADQAFAAAVDATLADPRSRTGGGQVTLQRVNSADPSFRISLTSQMTVRSPQLCGWDIPLEASCFNKQAGRVIIDDARWSLARWPTARTSTPTARTR